MAAHILASDAAERAWKKSRMRESEAAAEAADALHGFVQKQIRGGVAEHSDAGNAAKHSIMGDAAEHSSPGGVAEHSSARGVAEHSSAVGAAFDAAIARMPVLHVSQ